MLPTSTEKIKTYEKFADVYMNPAQKLNIVDNQII